MIFAVQPVGVFKMGLVQRQLLSLEIHQVDKLRHAVRAGQSQSNSRVVARLEHHTVEQFLNGQLLSRLKVDRRTLDTCRFLRDLVDHIQIAVLQNHNGGHDLRGTGNQAFLICVVRI